MENWTEVCEPAWCEALGCMVQVTIHWGEKKFDERAVMAQAARDLEEWNGPHR